MISEHPIFTGFRGLTGCQWDPRDRGVTNRMTEEDGKRYIGMTMIKFAFQFWQNLNPETKASALEGESLTNILTKVVHLLRT